MLLGTTLLPGFASRSVACRDGRVGYYVAGEGPPLVLVHGLGGAATNWTELASLLARRWRVIVPDLPGHGASEPLGRAAAGIAPFADAVRACLEAEEARRPVLVGHSFGGLLVLRIALAAPDAARALVLAAPSGVSSTRLKARIALEVMASLRPARHVARHALRIAASRELRRLAFWGLVADADRLSAEGALGFLHGARIAADTRTAARAMVRDDPRAELDRLGVPALLLWGARDQMLPVDDGIELARRLRCPLRILADTGHLLIGERPRQCELLIESFLAASAAPARASVPAGS